MSQKLIFIFLQTAILTFLSVALLSPVTMAQTLDRIQRGHAKDMLNAVKNEIKDRYYDKTFRGIDLEARFKAAEEKLNQANSLGQAFGIVAQAVLDLNDSHTTFYPPPRAFKTDYGWQMQMIGEKCFVTAVRPKSDAEAKGLKIGDEVLAIENFRPTRKEMWKVMYYYNQLSPRPGLRIEVQSPNSPTPRSLDIEAKTVKLKTVLKEWDLYHEYELQFDREEFHRYQKIGSTTIWKMPSFAFDPGQVDIIMQGKIKSSNSIIFDLRGNGGGYVVTLEKLVGYFFDRDIKIAELKGRKPMKPQLAKTQGDKIFKGKIVVLIDSNSGSAAEIFARVMQLENRGVVIGDRSAGAVMQSIGVPMELGVSTVIPYYISVTNADVIMSDGKSLEHVGVAPDKLMLPDGAELAAGRDPILAVALETLSEKITPEQAGKLFPFKWKDF